MIKRIQRIDEGIEVYELKQSLLWDRMIRKAKCIQYEPNRGLNLYKIK